MKRASKHPELDAATRRLGSDEYRPCGPCANGWHDPFPADTLGAVGSTCPNCSAVMMAGGPVRPAFAAEYQRRLAESICLRSRGGLFLCDAKADRSGGSCLCRRHGGGRGADRAEQRADDAAYTNTVERDHS